MATHFSFLAWRIPCGQMSLAGYSPWDCKESDTGTDIVDIQYFFCICKIFQSLHYFLLDVFHYMLVLKYFLVLDAFSFHPNQ